MPSPDSSPPWFSRVGTPVAPDEAPRFEAVRRELPSLARIEVACIGHWHEAGGIVRAAERDGTWWDREEEERERLWERAAQDLGEARLAAELEVAGGSVLRAAIRAAAAAATSRQGVVDPELAREAVSAALLAVHQRALARLAGAGADHYFAAKYALFAGGRWPLGVHEGRYWVF